MEAPRAPPPLEEYRYSPGFIVSHQKLEFDIDFARRSLVGHTEITILPQRRELKELRFNVRQCDVPESGILVNGRPADSLYEDAYEKLDIPDYLIQTAHQHEVQRDRLKGLVTTKPTPGELVIIIPRGVRIEDVNPFSEHAPSATRDRALATVRATSVAINGGSFSASTPIQTPKTGEDQSMRFAPLVVSIKFIVKNFRDGLHWVGVEDGDTRYPHVYTKHSLIPGIASCIFPCLDDPAMRCTWEIVVKCGRTLGDALKRPPSLKARKENGVSKVNGHNGPPDSQSNTIVDLSNDDKLLEMNVVCAGELTHELPDPNDSTKKIVSFLCSTQVGPQHIGFAVGPFEQVDLSEFREDEGNDKLGQKAVKVNGYCLPDRSEELRNTCETMAFAVDWFSLNFGSYPFPDYKLCFVDDQGSDTEPIAAMSLCSSRLLFPEDIIDPEVEVTRTLIHALASQWIGVSIIAAQRSDMWVVVGVSHFITELCMQKLSGNNEYRFRMKSQSDKLVELDIQRPSLFALGEILHLGQFEMDFMVLKAPLVLFILDRRLTKLSGSTGIARVISRLLYNASIGELTDKTVTTEGFRRLCEKIGHYKLDAFFNQWVMGAGCPRFLVTQKFNKKKLAVEMTISQKQDTLPTQRRLEKEAFLREFKEETNGVYAGDVQSVFTGPMTIRIHESDGTPYEHIVEIREGVQKIEIPYHTKYKRLKRSRREKERAAVGAGVDITADNHDDVLLYCLGDVLQSREEVKEWGLVDWDAELELKMESESYEWIRMDADFEWICELTMNMPSYMYLSQLQQDRDVVAQQDSMLFLGKSAPHPLVSTILIRTLMDRRYFHGIREMAADYLAIHATEGCNWIGRIHLEKAFQEFFCYTGSNMPRSNNFTDKTAYLIKCAIPKAMARVRDNNGKCPKEARQFILDQLRFNDNGNNEFSDYYYICTLMRAIAESLIPRKNDAAGTISFGFDEEDQDELISFQQAALEEIERYRRMDEWILSYQNIYTTTALDCKKMLMKSKVITPHPKDLFAYTHDGTIDLVRIKAFEALADLGFLQNDNLLKYFLNVMSTDSSPFLRDRLVKILFMALGAVALGERKKPETEPAPEEDGGLIIEDVSMEAKKAHVARTTSIEGALLALKEELEKNETFKKGLWDAVKSKEIGIYEQLEILDICSILYPPIESMIVRMKYPRYWKVKYLGKGKLVFKKTKEVRSKPISKPKPTPLPQPVVVQQQKPQPLSSPVRTPSINLQNGMMKPPKRPLPSGSFGSTSAHPAKMIKLCLSKEKLEKFPHNTRSPLPSKPSPSPSVSSTSSASGIPKFSRPSVVSPLWSGSPTPSASVAPPKISLATTSIGGTPKPRVPLPGVAARVPLPTAASTPSPSAPAKKPSLKLKFSFTKKPPSSPNPSQ